MSASSWRVYAKHEVVRDLAEKLHHEARTENIYEIIGDALEKAYATGWKESNQEGLGFEKPASGQ